MARGLAPFLLQLVTAPGHRNAFEKATAADKRGMMKKFDLTPSEQDAVLSGKLADLLKILSEEYGPKPGDFHMP